MTPSPICEVCGKPATNWAQDVYVRERFDRDWIERSPSGIIHAGCDQHPAKSREIDISTPLADAIAALDQTISGR